MQITKIYLKDFRCIEELEIELSESTVIIGENNAGKSSVLDAVKIALGRKWGRSGATGFSEFDFRSEDGKGVVPISLMLEFAEAAADEWPAEVTAALNDIIRTEPHSDVDSVLMRVNCTFESVSKSVEPEWQFLNDKGVPFSGKGARNQNLQAFFDYVPSFSMAAIRDATNEFGNRSMFWLPLLKSIEVPDDRAAELEARFASLNDELLAADPKLDSIKSALGEITSVIASGAAGAVDVRAIPVKLWDIIRRSELVVQGRGSDPWLPIARHGHGVQSLSVIFLFRAFVEHVLSASRSESTPILTLEEPEAHLHPQACRALWRAINELPGQKIITTHSPYFVQNVPFKDLIILRRGSRGPLAYRIKQKFRHVLPKSAQLDAFAAANAEKYNYDDASGELVCHGVMTEQERRKILMCYASQRELHGGISSFAKSTISFISDDDISKLESWAKRIRGEIFFARKWILCEGQAEYAVLHAVADHLSMHLDAHGISIIDYQNNGSPGAFAALARSLGFEWVMLCDGDAGGDDHISQLRGKGFEDEEIANRVLQFGKGVDLEKFLYDSDFRQILVDAVRDTCPLPDEKEDTVLSNARSNKEQVAVKVAHRIRSDAGKTNTPKLFADLIGRLKG